MNIAKANAALVDALGSAFRSGDHALGTVPGLLKRILREEAWREFITQRGELVQHARFVDFITTPPLQGIGGTVDLLRRIIADDTEALDLLDRALQGQHGGDRRSEPATNVDIINVGRSTGTSREAALRRLRKDRPDLHERVLAGELSPHRAMIEAGFRSRTFTVRVDDPAAAVRALRKHSSPEFWAEIRKLINE